MQTARGWCGGCRVQGMVPGLLSPAASVSFSPARLGAPPSASSGCGWHTLVMGGCERRPSWAKRCWFGRRHRRGGGSGLTTCRMCCRMCSVMGIPLRLSPAAGAARMRPPCRPPTCHLCGSSLQHRNGYAQNQINRQLCATWVHGRACWCVLTAGAATWHRTPSAEAPAAPAPWVSPACAPRRRGPSRWRLRPCGLQLEAAMKQHVRPLHERALMPTTQCLTARGGVNSGDWAAPAAEHQTFLAFHHAASIVITCRPASGCHAGIISKLARRGGPPACPPGQEAIIYKVPYLARYLYKVASGHGTFKWSRVY